MKQAAETEISRRIVVAGGINIDIGAVSFAPVRLGDSNPGRSHVSMGGVGRNIAHNLCLLGEKVTMLTAIGDDDYVPRIEAHCRKTGIDISRARRVSGAATSTYIYLCGPDGEMTAAVSDMAVTGMITPDYLEENRDVLEAADLVVLDANLPEESICWLTENCSSPLFADPVSTAKALRLLPALGKIHTLKPNRMEAEILSGVMILDENSLKKAAEKLLDTGLKRVFITLGREGVLAAEQGRMLHLSCTPAVVQNTTGAGDAFMAALAAAGPEEDIDGAVRFALAAAAITTETTESISSRLSMEAVRSRMLAET